MNNRLQYRRQFLLSRQSIDDLREWQHLSLRENLHLYCHPDLDLVYSKDSIKQIVLLGYLFDYTDHDKSNRDILSDIMEKTKSFSDFVEFIKKYSGRYIFIYSDQTSFNILSDTIALREIYYCTVQNRIICGSQPNLIDHFSVPSIGVTNDHEILKFSNIDRKSVGVGDYWVGDETYYENVKHLMPNHYLNINTLKAHRFWPNQVIKKRDLNEAVSLSCQYLQGILKAVTKRYPPMIAVTSGIDSRTILAASKVVKDKIYYFINKEKNLSDNSADIKIPKKLFNKLNLDFHVHEIEHDVDDKFKTIFLNNTFLSTERIITTIYNIYYKKHSDKINIRSIGEIGRTMYGNEPRRLNGYYLAYKIGYNNSEYVVKQCNKWLENNLDTFRKCAINPLTMFLWEQNGGNWTSVGTSEADIAIEEFNPYNGRYLYEVFLSVPKKYSKYKNNIFFRKMIKEMWPELLDFQINPPDSGIEHLRLFLKNIGVHKYLWLTKYKLNYIAYLLRRSA